MLEGSNAKFFRKNGIYRNIDRVNGQGKGKKMDEDESFSIFAVEGPML